MFLLPVISIVWPETGVKCRDDKDPELILKDTEKNDYCNIMSIETELKARVEKQDCKKRLETIAGQGVVFVKDDAYWFPGFSGLPDEGAGRDPRNGWLPCSGLRVRREKKAGKETTLVTWKKKEKRDGMEINDEREFTVSCGTLFEEFLYTLGLRKKIIKHKKGWAWNIDGVTAELAEVSGITEAPNFTGDEIPDSSKSGILKTLGWFLELEILDCGDETAARRRLLDALAKVGIGEASIENRYYSELLAAQRP
jgi:adenylate cyclase class 2